MQEARRLDRFNIIQLEVVVGDLCGMLQSRSFGVWRVFMMERMKKEDTSCHMLQILGPSEKPPSYCTFTLPRTSDPPFSPARGMTKGCRRWGNAKPERPNTSGEDAVARLSDQSSEKVEIYNVNVGHLRQHS